MQAKLLNSSGFIRHGLLVVVDHFLLFGDEHIVTNTKIGQQHDDLSVEERSRQGRRSDDLETRVFSFGLELTWADVHFASSDPGIGRRGALAST
jgi:hypothetical protein